jgi:hypothetical protein
MTTASDQQKIDNLYSQAQGLQTTLNGISNNKSIQPDSGKQVSPGVYQYYSSGGKAYTSNVAPSTTINSNSLQDTPAVTLPTQDQPTVQNSNINANNAGLVGGLTNYGVTTDNTGKFVYSPTDNTNTNQNSLSEQKIKSLIGLQDQAPNAQQIYQDSGAAQVDQARQQVQNYTGQINTITANRDASQMALVGQGRGITESIIGGQQAQIGREAAIQALPIQALLANAQGNLELAQQHLDTTFKLKMADAQSQFQYKQDLRKSIFDILDAGEKKIADAQSKTADRNFTLYGDTLSTYQKMVPDLIQNGDALTASKLAQLPHLDVNSPTFVQDFANLQTQASSILAGAKPDASKALDMQYKRAQINALNDKNGSGTGTGKNTSSGGVLQLAQAKNNIDLVDNVLNNSAIRSAVGTNVLTRFIGSGLDKLTGKQQDFIAGVEQLKSQLTLDNLVNAKKNGATFGALSEGELQLLNNSATKLGTWEIKDSSGNVVGYKTNEKSFKQELDKINNFAKLDYITRGGNAEDVKVKIMPDGSYVTQNSDGTYTQLK